MTTTPPPKSAAARRDKPAAGAPARSRTSVGQVFAAVAGFVALAAIGAAIGWGVTKAPNKLTSGGPTTPTLTSPVSSPPSTPTSPSASASGDVFTIPDYAAAGTAFQLAREDLRKNKLGVTLVFLTSGPAAIKVTSTLPAAGSQVSRGFTVKVFVDGTPPGLAVPPPPQAPTTCADWGKQLAATGFIPVYSPPGSKNLKLAAEDPGPDSTGTVWNQKITLTCTVDGQVPTPPPSGPPSAPPSGPASPSP